MQKRSLGKQLWELFGPLLLYMVVATVVEFIIFFVYYAMRIPAMIDTIQTMDDFMEIYYDMLVEVLQYGTEITALAAATIALEMLYIKASGQ